jgi:hypothetical protein
LHVIKVVTINANAMARIVHASVTLGGTERHPVLKAN